MAVTPLTQVGSSFSTPTQYTLQSPSLARYWTIGSVVNYGDYTDTTPPQNTAGIVANGFVYVQYHVNNQWTTGTIYTTQTGAQIATALNQ